MDDKSILPTIINAEGYHQTILQAKGGHILGALPVIIVDSQIVVGKTIGKINANIEELKNNGWFPLGSAFIYNELLCQTMVRYDFWQPQKG